MLINALVDGLVKNPALPETLVRRLIRWRGGSGGIAGRDDLSAVTVEEIITTGDHRILHTLALNQAMSGEVKLRLARLGDPSVRAALALRSEHGPRELFELLAGDSGKSVKEYLAQNGRVPEDIRARLADDPDPKIRATLAQYWNGAPEQIRRKLLTDPSPEVRAAACSTYFRFLPHPTPPADLVPALLADPLTRAGAARHAVLTPPPHPAHPARPTADPAHAAQPGAGRGRPVRPTAEPGLVAGLVADPDYQVRRELARHPTLPPAARDLLAVDSSAAVQVVLFGREDLPAHLRWAIHEFVERRAANPVDLVSSDLEDDLLEQVIEDNMAIDELRLGSLPWVTADPLPHVTSRYIGFRVAAARAADTLPPEAVRTLLDDEDLDVRRTVLSHAPHLVEPATAEQIEREWSSRRRKVRWRPADSYPFPPESLRHFATDPNPRIRDLAVTDPDLPVPVLTALAADTDPSVRQVVAGHPRLPVEVLLTLLEDDAGHVATAAAASPSLPLPTMEEILNRAGL
ncbi:hypothetical protein [Actinoplanes couchii]|uniref:Leucine rich repeat variant n=1 Tax=Actinoplanes couchii TaxID=403638 RepID=A0ABQ3XHS2_9ACTN|nr:hypothetical protein [Actinoplanes couchii]MDR6317575.1 hypothetical protein [Actinoplanes couchii]GID57960.1 hypothetical protein Aco03nite_063640 [Actinoplanes couchii]